MVFLFDQIKYGVISESHLETDLKEWHPFFVSGRLQKPVGVEI